MVEGLYTSEEGVYSGPHQHDAERRDDTGFTYPERWGIVHAMSHRASIEGTTLKQRGYFPVLSDACQGWSEPNTRP